MVAPQRRAVSLGKYGAVLLLMMVETPLLDNFAAGAGLNDSPQYGCLLYDPLSAIVKVLPALRP